MNAKKTTIFHPIPSMYYHQSVHTGYKIHSNIVRKAASKSATPSSIPSLLNQTSQFIALSPERPILHQTNHAITSSKRHSDRDQLNQIKITSQPFEPPSSPIITRFQNSISYHQNPPHSYLSKVQNSPASHRSIPILTSFNTCHLLPFL